jgi:TonB family protein
MYRVALIVAAASLAGVIGAGVGAAQTDALPPVRVGNGIPPPVKTKDVKPVYPADAQAARVQGVVVVEATIGPAGRVVDAHVMRSIPLLDGAALDAVRQWEFTPTVVGGVARSVVVTVTVNFSLGNSTVPPAPPGFVGPPARFADADPPSMILLTATAPGADGTRQMFEISPGRAERLPRWDQRIAVEPPLSILDARKAAEAWLKTRAREVSTFDIGALSLLRTFPRPPQAGACGSSGCWFYRFTFDPIVGDRRLAGGNDYVAVVLLDGSIVEPRVESAATGASASGAVPTPRPATPVDRGPGGVYRFGDVGITMPRVLREVRAQYTSDAMRAKIQGTVVLEATVTPDGTVEDVHIVRSLDPTYGLDQEAMKAARQWRFAPGTRLGVPVPVRVTMELSFTIRK